MKGAVKKKDHNTIDGNTYFGRKRFSKEIAGLANFVEKGVISV